MVHGVVSLIKQSIVLIVKEYIFLYIPANDLLFSSAI